MNHMTVKEAITLFSGKDPTLAVESAPILEFPPSVLANTNEADQYDPIDPADGSSANLQIATLASLPPEIIINIFAHLRLLDRSRFARCSKYLAGIAQEHQVLVSDVQHERGRVNLFRAEDVWGREPLYCDVRYEEPPYLTVYEKLTCDCQSPHNRMSHFKQLQLDLLANRPSFAVTAGLLRAAIFEAALDSIERYSCARLSYKYPTNGVWMPAPLFQEEVKMQALERWWTDLVWTIDYAFRPR